MDATKPARKPVLAKRVAVAVCTSIGLLVAGFFYFLATSPFSSFTIVRPAFSTAIKSGQVTITTNYTPHVYSGGLAEVFGLVSQGVNIFWDRLRSPKLSALTLGSIEDQIYAKRFNPANAYLISGDQFDGLYLRNLSVFYQDLLDPSTITSASDLHNRERIAVQSLAYGLSALQQLHHPVTTLIPASPHALVAVNIYAYPSDSMYGLFGLVTRLEADPATKTVTKDLVAKYGRGLALSYVNYLQTVRDPATGLVRGSVALSSARDSVKRTSSFYDNVILWKTEQLATTLGFDHASPSSLATLRSAILTKYWDQSDGHFIDDAAPADAHSYSSDWLIALPTGFLSTTNPDDLKKLERIQSYIIANQLASPLPIRYTSTQVPENIAVKIFASNYGSTAIWSYWGDLYMSMLESLYTATGNPRYAITLDTDLASWQSVIVRDHGYPETLNQAGKIYETPFYESIRTNGWIVDFQAVKASWAQVAHP